MSNKIDSMLKFLASKSYVTGETDGWEWIKWADGRCELWRTENKFAILNYWQAVGPLFYGEWESINYPFKLTKLLDCNVSMESEDTLVWVAAKWQNESDSLIKTPIVGGYTAYKDSYRRKIAIRYHIIGRWK